MLKKYISPLGVKRRTDVREMGDVKRGFLARVGVLCLPVSSCVSLALCGICGQRGTRQLWGGDLFPVSID